MEFVKLKGQLVPRVGCLISASYRCMICIDLSLNVLQAHQCQYDQMKLVTAPNWALALVKNPQDW